MKKRFRKTGEIVDIIDWFNFYRTERDKEDTVSYVDSKGVEHHNERGLNLWWDFEDIEAISGTGIDWEQRKYEIAKEMLKLTCNFQQLNIDGISTRRIVKPDAARIAVEYADILIAELKKGGEK